MLNANTDHKATFVCQELEPSAYLWARGVRFVGIEPAPTPNNPRHVAFCFHHPVDLCLDELAAYERGAEIPARLFALALRQLKDQIFRVCSS
jgi:hypothetical protein